MRGYSGLLNGCVDVYGCGGVGELMALECCKSGVVVRKILKDLFGWVVYL